MIQKHIVILGVTGSIGIQALEVIRAFPNQFSLKGMSGYSNLTSLIKIANEFRPSFIAVSTNQQRADLIIALDYEPVVFVGEKGLVELVQIDMDQLLVAIVGTAALEPVVAAIPKVNHIAIANKEVLVSAGLLLWKWLRNTVLI